MGHMIKVKFKVCLNCDLVSEKEINLLCDRADNYAKHIACKLSKEGRSTVRYTIEVPVNRYT